MDENEDRPFGQWGQDPDGDRMTRLAAAVSEMLAGHPEGGEDVRGIVMMRDGQGASGAGAVGYGEHPGAELAADFVRFAGRLFMAAGIRMTVRFTGDDGTEQDAEFYQSPLAESEPGQPDAELVIAGMASDEAMQRACTLVRDALKQEKILDGARVVILLGRSDETSVLMHHGYPDPHQVIHTLIAAVAEASQRDGSSHIIALLPGGHPN
jgi:hypothetical protein